MERDILGIIKNICNDVVDDILPPACPMCGEPLGFEGGKRLRICNSCRGKVTYLTGPLCLQCGKKLDDEDEEYCTDCKKHKHIFDQSTAVYEYSDVVKDAVYRFKYHNKREYAATFAEEMAERCKCMLEAWKPEIIIPVPIHYLRYKKRRYNQAELIADKLGKMLGIPVDSAILVRVKNTLPMKELSDEARLKNLQSAFQVQKNVVPYKKVLIVDDIYTTGATLDAVAGVLKKAGAESVYGITLCIGSGF